MIPRYLRSMKNLVTILGEILPPFGYAIMYIYAPVYFMFIVMFLRPAAVEALQIGTKEEIVHITLGTFLFINVIGNMRKSVKTDTRVSRTTLTDGYDYCEHCKMERPARSWHCRKCHVCILRRDHHCFVFKHCIGLNNRRYYLLYLAYLAISMIYTTYYTWFYLVGEHELNMFGLAWSVFCLVNPYLRYALPKSGFLTEYYVTFLMINVLVMLWAGGLFCYHFRNAIFGVTTTEFRTGTGHSMLRKENIVDVFGTRWYLAILWPFVSSPLPKAF